jgi:hypothetical protein
VIAVVLVMSIFKRIRCKLQSTNLGNKEAFLPKGRKSRFSGGKYPRIEKPFSKIEKRPDTKEISV